MNTPSDKPTPNKLFIVVSSDKGLCGGIHSSLTKTTRKALTSDPESPLPAGTEVSRESPIAVIGDKSKNQLTRHWNSNYTITFNQIGRDIPTFADAAGVADLIIKSGIKFESVVLVYNKFVSALSYETATMEVKGEEILKESRTSFDLFLVWGGFLTCTHVAAFNVYENDDEATKDLFEFSLANAIYATLVEGHACEQSARYVKSLCCFILTYLSSVAMPWTTLPKTLPTWLALSTWGTTVAVKLPSLTSWSTSLPVRQHRIHALKYSWVCV